MTLLLIAVTSGWRCRVRVSLRLWEAWRAMQAGLVAGAASPGVLIVAVCAAALVLGAVAGYAAVSVASITMLRSTAFRDTGQRLDPLADLMQLSRCGHQRPGFHPDRSGGTRCRWRACGARGGAGVHGPASLTSAPDRVAGGSIDAYRDLGGRAARIVFVAVNVNRYHLRVADVAAFSREQRRTTIPSWRFLTGQYPSLRTVAGLRRGSRCARPNADVLHSSVMYFIDPQGRSNAIWRTHG